jgi:ornithine decarboxylase
MTLFIHFAVFYTSIFRHATPAHCESTKPLAGSTTMTIAPMPIDSPARDMRMARRYATSLDVAAAASLERPVFCISQKALKAQADVFLKGFPGEVSYAVKANSSDQVIAALNEAGVKVFDVASTVEMASVARLCGQVEFHYHNPVKSCAEIATAWHTFGCRRFAADCAEEIGKVAQVAGHDSGAEIAIRFRMAPAKASVHDFTTKFGVDEAQAAELMQLAVTHGFVPVLTFHPGSQCTDPAAWTRHIEAAARIAKAAGIRLSRLNVGGGFPSRYAGSRGPALASFFDTIKAAAAAAFVNAVPALECEPGRALCAGSVSLLTKVKLVRRQKGDVFLNDGLYGGLMEVCQAPSLMPFYRVIRDGRVLETAAVEYTVYGPTCDPLDVLPGKLRLPADIQEDDVIEFGGIGAYGTATATRFNGYGAFDIVVTESAFAG